MMWQIGGQHRRDRVQQILDRDVRDGVNALLNDGDFFFFATPHDSMDLFGRQRGKGTKCVIGGHGLASFYGARSDLAGLFSWGTFMVYNFPFYNSI